VTIAQVAERASITKRWSLFYVWLLPVVELHRANLVKAYLRRAAMSGAKLSGTGLMEANLSGADLSGADLGDVRLHKTTMLPDDTQWTPDTDLARFTDPDHPDFWRSDDPGSPAYRGKDGEQ